MDRKRELRFALYGIADQGARAAKSGNIPQCVAFAKDARELMVELLPLLEDGPYKRGVESDLKRGDELIAQFDEVI